MAADDEGRLDEYESYLSYRRYLQEMHLESAQSFDRTLFALSGGALAISLAFIDNLPAGPVFPWLLGFSWALLGFSLLTNLLSIYAAERDFFEAITSVDDTWEARTFPKGIMLTRFQQWVPRLNRVSLWLFVLGLVGLLVFAISSLLKGARIE